MNGFGADVEATRAALASAKTWGALGSFFTIGIWSNAMGIAAANKRFDDAERDLAEFTNLRHDIASMRKFLDVSVVEHGVRVALCIFPDVALDGHATYGPYWSSIRQTVLERDSYTCKHSDAWCSGPLQIHHIRPLSKGGSNFTSNLLTLCRHHHGLQHPGNPHFER